MYLLLQSASDIQQRVQCYVLKYMQINSLISIPFLKLVRLDLFNLLNVNTRKHLDDLHLYVWSYNNRYLHFKCNYRAIEFNRDDDDDDDDGSGSAEGGAGG